MHFYLVATDQCKHCMLKLRQRILAVYLALSFPMDLPCSGQPPLCLPLSFSCWVQPQHHVSNIILWTCPNHLFLAFISKTSNIGSPSNVFISDHSKNRTSTSSSLLSPVSFSKSQNQHSSPPPQSSTPFLSPETFLHLFQPACTCLFISKLYLLHLCFL